MKTATPTAAEKTSVELTFWSKGDLLRVYANIAGSRDSLGYFQMRESREERPHGETASYYDRHRWCKGDDEIIDYSQVTWSGDEAVRDALLTAIFGNNKVGFCANWQEAVAGGDRWGFFRALQENCCRGFSYFVHGKSSKDPAVRKRAREVEAQNKARAALKFEIEVHHA